MKAECRIYFELPFWTAIFERWDENGYSAARYVFGGEPNDAELLVFARQAWKLVIFSAPVDEKPEDDFHQISFKRRQRQARQAAADHGFIHRAWQAIQEERDSRKVDRQVESRTSREADIQRQFLERQRKRKEKHRGH